MMSFQILQAMKIQKQQEVAEAVDMRRVMVEIRSMVLRRECHLRVQIGLLRKQILDFLPLNHMDDHEAVDLLFTSPVSQQVLLEHIQKTLMLWGFETPTENEVCMAVMETLFSRYFRAHAAYGKRLSK